MFADILTITWKEAKEFIVQRPSFRGGWLGLLVFIGVFGVVMPLQSGAAWVDAPETLLLWVWVPFILVNSIVADSFAGERERHTLETLLATRLSDRAILFGKIAASLGYGWGLTLISLLVSLITINAANWQGGLMMFSFGTTVGILALSFLVAALAATLGVLISLRASSVREAQQTLSMAMFLVIIPLVLLPLLPDALQAVVNQALIEVNMQAISIGLGVVLLVVDIVLLLLGMARFRRARLILD